jgi:TolB-like protein
MFSRRVVLGAAGLAVLIGIGFSAITMRQPTTSVPAIRSLAVLPLQNLSGDAAQEYFSDGMTEELITELSRIGALKVISRTSVMRYKKSDKPLAEIARELNVDGIVEGSVLRSGDRVRITAQLIYAPKDVNIWAETYDHDLRDVLDLQRTVAGAVAREIKVKMTPGETARLKRTHSVNPKALDAYLEGQYRIRKCGYGDEECRKAFACFERAIAEDPKFAQAYTAIAYAYTAMMVRPANVWELQQAAGETALAIDPDSADAHVILGVIRANRDWDWAAAETEFRKAIELDPNNADAHDNLGMLLDWMTRQDEALRELELAQALDPVTKGYVIDFVRSTSFKRKYHDEGQLQAIARLRNIADYDADDCFIHLNLYELYADNDMDDAAMEQLQRAAFGYGYKDLAAHIRQVYGSSGAKEAARVYAAEIERANQSGQLWRPVMVAEAYARAGDKEKAWQWLQKSFELRDFQLLSTISNRNDKLVKMFRSDQRYAELVRRIGRRAGRMPS